MCHKVAGFGDEACNPWGKYIIHPMRRCRCLVSDRRKENVRSSNSVKTPSVQLRPFYVSMRIIFLTAIWISLALYGRAMPSGRKPAYRRFFIVTSRPSHEGLRRQGNDSLCKGKKKNINTTIGIVLFFLIFFGQGGIRWIWQAAHAEVCWARWETLTDKEEAKRPFNIITVR